MPQVEPVLIFDMDGTILAKNSFPVWAMTMAGLSGMDVGLRQRLAVSFAVQRLVLRRKLRQLDHDSLLRQLQSIWHSIAPSPDAPLARRLQMRLLRLVRPNLTPVLRLVAEDAMDGILATAAAAEYAEPLGRKLGFTHIIATPPQRSVQEPHNSGNHKRDRVLAFLRDKDWHERPLIFFNDDMADLPLMQACQAVCWFGSNRGMRKATHAASTTRFLPCRAMRPGEMSATVAHLSQSLAAAQLAKMPWVFPAAQPRARISL